MVSLSSFYKRGRKENGIAYRSLTSGLYLLLGNHELFSFFFLGGGGEKGKEASNKIMSILSQETDQNRPIHLSWQSSYTLCNEQASKNKILKEN